MDSRKSSVIRSSTRSGVVESMISNQACSRGVAGIVGSSGSGESLIGQQGQLGVERHLVAGDKTVLAQAGRRDEVSGRGRLVVDHRAVGELQPVDNCLPEQDVTADDVAASGEVVAQRLPALAAYGAAGQQDG